MRFESLILERFGMFEGASLDFGGGGLHVVYGANEAGKSTALAAISDLLFGIDERTPFNFRFDYGKLRIGAKLVNSNGARLEFKRRKARAGTLVSLSLPETTLPDGALTPFVGAVDRDQFQFMFGLDQERLRSGGKQMLDPHGNFAHALFAAGTGLESVNTVLVELDEEIKALGSLLDRRSKGEIWSAIDRFTAAITSKKADMIIPDHYLAAESARDDAIASRLKVDERLKELRTRRNFLERGRRVAPILAALRTLRNNLNEFVGVPDLPEEFAEAWKKADDDVRLANEAITRNRAEVDKLQEQLRALPPESPIIGYEETINSLTERLGKFLGDQDDLPKLSRRIVELNDQIQNALRSLGLEIDPANAETVLPNRITVAKLRELIKKSAVVRAKLDAARTEHDDAKSSLAEAEEAFEKLPPVVDVSEANALLDQATKLGDVTQGVAAATVDADSADLALKEAMGRLGLWSDGADDLGAAAVPDPLTVELFEKRLVTARQKVAAIDEKIEEIHRNLITVDADLAGLEAAGEVPSPKAIQEARDERNSQWRAIRFTLFQPPEASGQSFATGSVSDTVGAYETTVQHADALVDRRETEATRIAQLTTLTASRRKAAENLVEQNSQRRTAEDELQRLDTEWRELWSEARISLKSPAEMTKWLSRKEEVLRLLTEARKAGGKLRDARTTESRARTLLEKAGKLLGLEQGIQELSELDRKIRLNLSGRQAAATVRSEAITRLKTARDTIGKKKLALDTALAQEGEWRTAWSTAIVDIGLPAAAGPAEAEAALSAWEAITAPLTKRKEDQRRHKGLSEDLDRFRSDVGSLLNALGLGSVADAPIESCVRELKASLDAAKRASQEREAIGVRTAELQAAIDAESEKGRTANVDLDGIRRTYGIDPEADAYDLARRSARVRSLKTQIDERAKELAEAGDALDEEALQAEVELDSARSSQCRT